MLPTLAVVTAGVWPLSDVIVHSCATEPYGFTFNAYRLAGAPSAESSARPVSSSRARSSTTSSAGRDALACLARRGVTRGKFSEQRLISNLNSGDLFAGKSLRAAI